LGSLRYVRGLLPSAEVGSDLSLQLESVLERLRSVISDAGATMDDVARVTLFLREVKDRSVLNDVWSRWFPEPARRPPHKYLPADIPGGYEVMVDAVAVVGGQRRILTIPGLEHRDPMSMGARVGNLVFSSRLFGPETDPERQFALLLGHARALMADAGGDLDGLTQVTVFAPDQESAAALERLCGEYWSGAAARPAVHVLVVDLGGTGTPRMEVVGVVRDIADDSAGVRHV
jgi:enamine deaminase RidA (YjgF/YER057c/UK114 family)